MQDVVISGNLCESLTRAVEKCPHDRLFVLTDSTTLRFCWPLLAGIPCMENARMITIAPTDENKNLQSLSQVWTALQQQGATRHSLMVNLGGGMVTDLGGFAASTFKRGIAYINLPTTLLSMVDASVGGKTGINFGGLKNEIGVFNCASTVILHTTFLHTLDSGNICSGYAEMLKHSLLCDTAEWERHVAFPLDSPDFGLLTDMVRRSVAVKERIVEEDPTEQGIRKALNLGHTVGHAFESMALAEGRPVLHGYAVAWGLVCALCLSRMKLELPREVLLQTARFVRDHYGWFPIDCREYDRIVNLMTHDKKNEGGHINFTLLAAPGDVRINQRASREEILEMLDFFRENG